VKRGICFLLFSFTICKLAAQEYTWHEGALVLQTQQVLVGAIAVEAEHDIILFRSNDSIHIYPAHRIQYFQFFDVKNNINRKYVSLRESEAWGRHRLYEVVLNGTIDILRRQKRNVSPALSDADDFLYYIYMENNLLSLKTFRSKVYPALLKDGGVSLSMFVMEKNLSPQEPSHTIEIIRYYNGLVQRDAVVATR
jgi:hypothetical protein